MQSTIVQLGSGGLVIAVTVFLFLFLFFFHHWCVDHHFSGEIREAVSNHDCGIFFKTILALFIVVGQLFGVCSPAS